MTYFNLLIVLIIPLALGLIFLSLLLQKGSNQLGFWEKIALAFAIGLGFLVIMMFLLAIANIPLTFINILLAVLIIIISVGIYTFKHKAFCLKMDELQKAFIFKGANFRPFEYILIFLIALKVIYVFFSALIKPLVDVDAFQFYSIVAKGIFFDKTFLTPYLSQFIHDKPLFPFIAQGWAFIGLHTIHDALFKVLAPTLFVCFLVIFYSVLRRYYSRRSSLLFTFLLSSLPFLVFHAATAYADFTITFYYGAATIYLFLFMKEFNRQNKDKAHVNLMLASLLLAISVWSKKAGIALAGVNIFILFTYLLTYRKTLTKLDLKRALIAGLLFILLIAPSLAYGQKDFLIKNIQSIAGIGSKIQAEKPGLETPLPKTGVVLSIFTRKLFLYADWHLLWLLFLVSLCFFYRRSFSSPLYFLLAIIVLDVFALFVQFSTEETFRWLLDGTLFDRLVMNEVPVVLYFCAEAVLPSLKGRNT